MNPSSYSTHPVFQKLTQLNEQISKDDTKNKIDLEILNFFQTGYEYILDRLKVSVPILIQETQLNAIVSEINGTLKQIIAYIGNNNVLHLNNATNNLNSAISRINTFPVAYGENDFNFAEAIAKFQETLSEKYSEVKKQHEQVSLDLKKIEKIINGKISEITKLEKSLEQKELQIQNLNSSYQTEFNNIKSKINQEFENDRKGFRIEIDGQKKNFREEIDSQKKSFKDEISDLKNLIHSDTSTVISDLKNKLEEAKKIVNVVGNVSVTGNYQLIANEHKTSANFWRWVAIGFMGLLSILLIATVIDLSTGDFDWVRSLLRLLAAAALSYPATYAANESSKHRHLETLNRTAELELASINPFIEMLDDVKKQSIKEKLVDKYFGNNHQLSSEPREKVDVPLAVFERILNALGNVVKK